MKKETILRIMAFVYALAINASLIGAVALINYDNSVSGAAVFGIMAIPFVILIAGGIFVVKNFNTIDRTAMFDSVIIMKYCLIPLFTIGGIFICVMAFLSFIPVPFMILVGPMAVIFLSVAGWIYMITGLVFSLPYFIKSYKEKANGLIITVIGILCQFIFSADVIAFMVLTFKEKRLAKATIGLILTVILIVIVGIIWVIAQ